MDNKIRTTPFTLLSQGPFLSGDPCSVGGMVDGIDRRSAAWLESAAFVYGRHCAVVVRYRNVS